MNFNEKINKICFDNKVVGASLVVVSNNKIVQELGYGKSVVEESKDINKTNTVFRIASISKIIVATCIMQLVEQNRIGLNDDISDYFGFLIRNPKYPNEKITITHLMTQTSSITDGDDEETVGYNGVNGTSIDATVKDLLTPGGKYFNPITYSTHKPGTNFIYSNFGCGILACLVELLSGVLFTTYVRDNVLLPLGLDASFIPSDIKNDDICSTYEYNKDKLIRLRSREKFIKNEYKKFPLGDNYRGPAGGLFISMHDLAIFMKMLINKGIYNNVRILKEETVNLMLKKHWEGEETEGSYKAKGLQINIFDYFDNITLYGHFGSAYGVRSFMFFNPIKKYGMVFISNGGKYHNDNPRISTLHENIMKTCMEEYL